MLSLGMPPLSWLGVEDVAVRHTAADRPYQRDGMRLPFDPSPHEIAELLHELALQQRRRRVATRYDKTRESHLGFVAFASINL